MNGIKVVFEFSAGNEFTREAFEMVLLEKCKESNIEVANVWCFLDIVVMPHDFPISYTVNEYIVELIAENGASADMLYSTFQRIVLNANWTESFIKIKNMTYKEVLICNSAKADTNKKVFVTGVTGQLGHDVMNRLYELGYEPIGSGYSEEYVGVQENSYVPQLPYISLDITNSSNVKTIISEINPYAVIHCAAWNAVDSAEDKARKNWVKATNEDGTRCIAEVCRQIGAKMVYISTDYVFDGEGEEPWNADAEACNALNVYGQTKLGGELAVSEILEKYFIVRTSWAYGINGNNFVKTMLKIGEKSDTVRVIDDQIGTPTYMKDLARLVVDMISTEKYGHYNATNEGGYISWYEFACEIFKQSGLATNVLPVSTKDYGRNKATRPYNSRLDKSKLVENGFEPLPDWKDALGRYLRELNVV